jgi:MFS family permease
MALLLQGYTAALIGCLIAIGGISDALGRKQVLTASVVCCVVATAIVLPDPGVLSLGIARWFQGLGVGLSMGSSVAWLSQLANPKRAARIIGLASTAGFAGGPLLTELVLRISETSVSVSYVLWTLALVLSGISLLWVSEEAATEPRPALVRLPTFPPGTLLAGGAISLGWSVAGIIVAVVPGIMTESGDGAWAGATLFVLLAAGTVAQVDARRRAPLTSLKLGAVVLTIGTAVLATGLALGSTPLTLFGAAVAGSATHAWLYVGGLARVAQCAPGSASSVSGFFLFAYLGFGLPAIGLGWAADTLGTTGAMLGLACCIGIGAFVLYRAVGYSKSWPETEIKASSNV